MILQARGSPPEIETRRDMVSLFRPETCRNMLCPFNHMYDWDFVHRLWIYRLYAPSDDIWGISIVAWLHCRRGMWQTVRNVSFSIRT